MQTSKTLQQIYFWWQGVNVFWFIHCIDELHILDDQIINARELLLAGKIEPSDFKILKMDYDNKLNAINLDQAKKLGI